MCFCRISVACLCPSDAISIYSCSFQIAFSSLLSMRSVLCGFRRTLVVWRFCLSLSLSSDAFFFFSRDAVNQCFLFHLYIQRRQPFPSLFESCPYVSLLCLCLFSVSPLQGVLTSCSCASVVLSASAHTMPPAPMHWRNTVETPSHARRQVGQFAVLILHSKCLCEFLVARVCICAIWYSLFWVSPFSVVFSFWCSFAERKIAIIRWARMMHCNSFFVSFQNLIHSPLFIQPLPFAVHCCSVWNLLR